MESHSTSNLVIDLGRVPYEETLRLQREIVGLVRETDLQRVLLFLEHDPVYTVGRKFSKENFPSVNVIETERGGDVTYHGPGQLVVYPIFRIGPPGSIDVRSYVTTIERITISALRKLGFDAYVGEEPGIWIRTDKINRKVASIGMAIDHGVSFHGIAINYSSEVIPWFNRIRPCGMNPNVMGWVDTDRNRLKASLLVEFSDIYGRFEAIDITAVKSLIRKNMTSR